MSIRRKKYTLSERMRRRAFNWKVRQGLYRHLAVQVGNERPLTLAMEDFQKRLKRRGKTDTAKVLGDMVRRLKNGNTLAEALKSWAPQDEIMALSSGELAGAGKLAESIELLIDSKERVQRVTRAFRSSFLNSLIYLIVIYGFLYAVGVWVTPSLTAVLPPERAQGASALLFSLGDYFTSLWSVAPPALFGIIVFLAFKSLPTWTGKWRRKVEPVFPYTFYRSMEGYKWLQGYGSLLQSGMPETKILARQCETATPWLRERLNATKDLMENGSSLSQALTATGYGFPSLDMIDDIESMQGFPDFPVRVTKLAGQWADDIEREVIAKAMLIGTIVEVFMMGMMAFLYVAGQSMSSQMTTSIPGM